VRWSSPSARFILFLITNMTSQLDNTANLIRQFVQSTVERLPEPAQGVVRAPLAQKAAALVVALSAVRAANQCLGRWAADNWQSAKPWRTERELVLITGGCGGIGRHIMEDLARTGVRVVILDVVEPKFKLREFSTLCLVSIWQC
jgi:FlaA1/EpsC-like NDP-sugar epimerase